MSIQIKRIYEAYDENDGMRILVDRIWPRGISKEQAMLDEWLKDVAPTKELRQWFHHEPNKFTEFKRRYIEELKQGKQLDALKQLEQIVASHKHVTLLYAAKDEQYNQAQVLKELSQKNEPLQEGS